MNHDGLVTTFTDSEGEEGASGLEHLFTKVHNFFLLYSVNLTPSTGVEHAFNTEMYITSLQVCHKILVSKDHICFFMSIAISHALQNRNLLLIMLKFLEFPVITIIHKLHLSLCFSQKIINIKAIVKEICNTN